VSSGAPRCAVATVAMGRATEHLDYTFTSFAVNSGVTLHAFILGDKLPERRLPEVQYHLVKPIPDYSHPLREVYFRRLELIEQLDAELVLTVDCYDVLCLQALPPFAELLESAHVAACVEHNGGRYVMGQGYTANFLNGGVFLWNVPASRDIRGEIMARGKARFRTVADDQFCINEVIQTRYYDRLRILPCQYNYRAYLNRKQRGWPTVTHLDGVMIYHNGACIKEAKQLMAQAPITRRASLPALIPDGQPLDSKKIKYRRLRQWEEPHLVRESIFYRFQQWGHIILARILRWLGWG